MRYDIRWSTRLSRNELQSGRHKPLHFVYEDETTPFPLKPGRTWIVVVTPQTIISEKSPGEWSLKFAQPEGAK
jgi:hypothetical protein